MPLLDVSDVLLDPMFAEMFGLQVLRRSETINGFGESVVSAEELNPQGVVTAGSAKPFDRFADGQVMPNTITVHSYAFRMIGPAVGYQPDIIVWQGSQYVVTKSYDYSLFGAGFTAADCEAMNYQDFVTP